MQRHSCIHKRGGSAGLNQQNKFRNEWKCFQPLKENRLRRWIFSRILRTRQNPPRNLRHVRMPLVILQQVILKPVLRILDILVRIRIPVPLTNGSGCGSGRPKKHTDPDAVRNTVTFTSCLERSKKTVEMEVFLLLYLLDDGRIRLDANPGGPKTYATLF